MEKVLHTAEILKLIEDNQQIFAPDLKQQLFHAEIAAIFILAIDS